jgi:PPM family protein phosphatase
LAVQLDRPTQKTIPVPIEFGARSDKGCIRENNEDRYCAVPEMGLYVLSDGMGGMACGEVASRLAVDTIVEHCRESEANPALPIVGGSIPGVSDTSNRLASAVRLANRAVYEASRQSVGEQPMGATVVAIRFADERVSIAHVGDSRAYRLRNAQIEQLTQDHSFVAEQVRRGHMTEEEAGNSRLQNVLVRALGVDASVEVTVGEELVTEDDTLLLCSDGLTRELSDGQIAALLAEGGDAQRVASHLIEMAKQAGGGDNITAIVLQCAPRSIGVLARIGRLGKWFKDSD